MNKSTIYFLFIITGIFATAIAYSNAISDNDAYGSSEKKYNDREYYGEKEYKDHDRGYDYKDGYKDDGYGKQTFVAKLNGDNVRPEPVNTPMTGFGKVIVTQKPNTVHDYYAPTELDYKVSVFDVPKNRDITAAHLHITAPYEDVGPHVLTLCGNPLNEIECPELLKPIVAGGALNEDLEINEETKAIGIYDIDDVVEALNEGRGYIQLHTNVNTDGEIRGDLKEIDNHRY